MQKTHHKKSHFAKQSEKQKQRQVIKNIFESKIENIEDNIKLIRPTKNKIKSNEEKDRDKENKATDIGILGIYLLLLA